jgi:hypothetical protein
VARLPYAILGMARDKADVQAAIDAASYLSEWQVRRGYAPLWWEDNATYAREEHHTLPGVERIQTAEELAAMGRGDCDDHAPALCGSLRAVGIPARAVVIDSPGIGYHVIVAARDAEGRVRVIDPSLRRGMAIGESSSTRKARRRRKALAAIRRASQLVAEAERLNPASRAAQALRGEASRLLDVATAERQAEESDPEEEA